MQALFVHGMGRTPISGWPLLRALRQAGWGTRTFGYQVTLESFAQIQRRLGRVIQAVADAGDYVLIGHSLGGVALRATLATLPPNTRRPRHLFLLGSPIRPARLAQRLRPNPLFRGLTRDCGDLLGSAQRMAEVPAPPPDVPVTLIAGTLGPTGRFSPFGKTPNDGVVSLPEVSAAWAPPPICLPILHTWLPASRQIARLILDTIDTETLAHASP